MRLNVKASIEDRDGLRSGSRFTSISTVYDGEKIAELIAKSQTNEQLKQGLLRRPLEDFETEVRVNKPFFSGTELDTAIVQLPRIVLEKPVLTPEEEEQREIEFKWKTKVGVIPDGPEVTVFISTFPATEGLFPDLWKPTIDPKRDDYNPNRVFSATWSKPEGQKGRWTWEQYGRTYELFSENSEEFTLTADRTLTMGQDYWWGVEFKSKGKVVRASDNFTLPFATAKTSAPNRFQQVTILTSGLDSIQTPRVREEFEKLADHLTQTTTPLDTPGLVLHFDPEKTKWYFEEKATPVNPTGRNYNIPTGNKSQRVVLIADWLQGVNERDVSTTGFAEAAADTLFASLVQLDQQLNGTVSGGYDAEGKLIRAQGALLNSPLHFIGFGQGAVVNTEIVQRLGTFFPNAGGVKRNDSGNVLEGDLQVTTIDPYEYSGTGAQGNVFDPSVATWENVTYADNYFQRPLAPAPEKVFFGRNIESADLNVDITEYATFDQLKPEEHIQALTWYSGTANVTRGQRTIDQKDWLPDGERIYRRLGDLDLESYSDEPPWYTPDHLQSGYGHGDAEAPWEGIGTGWFHSVLGGGQRLGLRPVKTPSTKLGVTENNAPSTSGAFDSKRVLGDFAVPTLFNGNFDAGNTPGWKPAGSQLPVAGWSHYNGSAPDVKQAQLITWDKIAAESTVFRSHLDNLQRFLDE